MACAWCSMIVPGTGSTVRGHGSEQPDQLEGHARGALRRHRLRPLSGLARSPGVLVGGVARYVAEPGVPEQVVPVAVGGEPGDHRDAERLHVIGELVEIGTIDAGIDQDQPIVPAHRDGIAPHPLALTDPDAVGHLTQHGALSTRNGHRLTRSPPRGTSPVTPGPRAPPAGPARPAPRGARSPPRRRRTGRPVRPPLPCRCPSRRRRR